MLSHAALEADHEEEDFSDGWQRDIARSHRHGLPVRSDGTKIGHVDFPSFS